MGFGFWVASYGSSNILWRGEQYLLEKGGPMRRLHGPRDAAATDSAEHESALTI